MSPRRRSFVALAALLALAGCRDESTFVFGRSLDTCDANIPTACTLSGSCVLDGNRYVEGTFPSARRMVGRGAGGDTMRISILFTEQRAPGTELLVTVHEPACTERQTYDSGGRNLFDATDDQGVLVLPFVLREPGDHLIELLSDAYCRYTLKIDVPRQDE